MELPTFGKSQSSFKLDFGWKKFTVAEYSATASSTEIGANFLEKSNSDSQASISSEENTIKANSKNNLLYRVVRKKFR